MQNGDGIDKVKIATILPQKVKENVNDICNIQINNGLEKHFIHINSVTVPIGIMNIQNLTTIDKIKIAIFISGSQKRAIEYIENIYKYYHMSGNNSGVSDIKIYQEKILKKYGNNLGNLLINKVSSDKNISNDIKMILLGLLFYLNPSGKFLDLLKNNEKFINGLPTISLILSDLENFKVSPLYKYMLETIG